MLEADVLASVFADALAMLDADALADAGAIGCVRLCRHDRLMLMRPPMPT